MTGYGELKPRPIVREVEVDVAADLDIPPCPVPMKFEIYDERDNPSCRCFEAFAIDIQPGIRRSVKEWLLKLEKVMLDALDARAGQLEDDPEKIMELCE